MNNRSNTKKKILSQKVQAVINLIIGILIILMFIIDSLGKMQNNTALQNISKVAFPFALGILMFTFGVALDRRKQHGDELSKELMLKAGSMAVFFELLAITILAIVMRIIGSSRGNNEFSIESSDVMRFATFICGVNIWARSAIFLWLDRNPKSEDEE